MINFENIKNAFIDNNLSIVNLVVTEHGLKQHNIVFELALFKPTPYGVHAKFSVKQKQKNGNLDIKIVYTLVQKTDTENIIATLERNMSDIVFWAKTTQLRFLETGESLFTTVLNKLSYTNTQKDVLNYIVNSSYNTIDSDVVENVSVEAI
jgi:hypothetical protein